MNVDPLRLAVLSTPRSGNCWLRHMLAETLGLEHIIVHAPSDVPWQALPPRAILQLHWLPDESFVSLLGQHGFRVVVMARHPLDVLISILAFSQHDDSTSRWLDGAAGDERGLAGATPLDADFLAYATGPRAKQLLRISAEWWNRADVCRVRYEDLVGDTAAQLTEITSTLGFSPRRSPAEVAAQSTPDQMRAQNVHMLFHIWAAQRSLWRRFLTAAAAERICEAHQFVLNTLGYCCDPIDALSQTEATAAWHRYDVAAAKKHLHGLKKTLCDVEARHHRDLHGQQVELDLQRANLLNLTAQIEQLRQRQAVFDGLGPWSLGTARRLQGWSGRFPRLSAASKSLVLFCRRALLANKKNDSQASGSCSASRR